MKTTSKNETTHSNGTKIPTGRALHNESGFAMVTALLLMVVMISLVPAAMQLSTREMDRASNFKETREAFFLAEAGLEHAKFLAEESSLRLVLAGPDDAISATPSDSENDDNGTFGLAAPVALPVDDGFVYDTAVLNGNTYYIRAFDNDDGDGDLTNDKDNMIFLSAVGVVDGTTTTVQALVYNPPGVPLNAVTANGNLPLGGGTTITGACGSVHANGDLTMGNSSTTVNGDATSTGTTTQGTTTVNGTTTSGAAAIPIPLLDVTEFKPYADYTLASDGNVYDKNGAFVSSSPWEGWSYQSSQQKWRNNNGNDAKDAFLYVEGNADMSNGSAGTPGNKWELTLVATGYIAMTGNDHIVNKKDPNLPPDIQNLFMVAGTDLDFSGNVSQNVDGILYATEQLKLSGSANITGAIMSYESFSTENLVQNSSISGGSTITYGCGLTVPSTTTIVNVVSWNEVIG